MRGTCAPAEVCAYPQADAELSRVPQPGLSWLELPLHSRLRFVAIGLRRLCLREVAESRDCDADRGVDKNEVDDHREEKAKVDRLTTYLKVFTYEDIAICTVAMRRRPQRGERASHPIHRRGE